MRTAAGQVAFEDITRSEICAALPEPGDANADDLSPGDPSTCRVLSRAAVLLAPRRPRRTGWVGWITVVGFGLVVGARRRRAERDSPGAAQRVI